jgi:Zn-dependent peptidase ImmA (M78 family)/transcriptional regulator with XRE-family HTH domain
VSIELKLQIESILKDSFESSLKELFEERRESLNLSFKQVSDILAIDYNTLKTIINGSGKIDFLNVLKLAHFLDIDYELFSRSFYKDNTNTVKELERVRQNSFLVNNFDLKTLKKEGFINGISDLEAIKKRINDFFGYESIYDYRDEQSFVLFSSTNMTAGQRMKRFWVKSAYNLFKNIDNPNPFHKSELKKLMPKIRPYTQYVDQGLENVARALYSIGVTVIFQPYLRKTAVRGGTFIVNGKPCVVITDYNKYYPTLWFALIHELHHVLFDLDYLRSNNQYHLTGNDDPELFMNEERKANEFARAYLFSKDKSSVIKPLISDHQSVKKYAKKHEVHPSIIYAFFQYDKSTEDHNFWGAFRKYFPDVKRATKNLNFHLWDRESLQKSAEDLKRSIQKI